MYPKIAILGAGPSGLTLARLLHKANIDYVIYEKDKSPIAAATVASGRGGTLDIHADTGQVALKEAGLLEEFKKIARYDTTTTISDAKGKVYLKVESDGNTNDKPEIDRKDLRTLLLNSIPAGKVKWGSEVQSVNKEGNGMMSVLLADGRIEPGFELVVGADGAWSKARSLVTSAKPQYSGIHYLTTSIQHENFLHFYASEYTGNGLYMAMGGGKQLVLARLGDGSIHVGLGLRLPEHWSSEQTALGKDPSAIRRSLLDNGFSEWSRAHLDFVRYSGGNFYAWPLYSMPVESLPWKSVPGITLVGDAAHVTMPFVGEGVNCAMYDSLQLARQIVKHGLSGLDRAVSKYEEEMFPRALDLIERSKKSGELYFAEDAPKGWLKIFAGIDTE